MKPPKTTEVAFLALLTTIGAGLRIYGLDTGLWYDEIVTLVESVRAPLGEIASQFRGDNHHPLYSVLAHLAVAEFGEHPWVLRLPAAMFGIATIPVLYGVGRAVTNRLEAGAASLILAVSYHHIWFSQNARGYTAVLFFVLLSTYALLRWFETSKSSLLALYAVATALGAYTHLTMVLVSLGQAMVCAFAWLTEDADRQVRVGATALAKGFAGAAVITALMYAPMLGDVGSVMTSGASSGGDQTSLSWTIAATMQGLQVGFGAVWGIVLGSVVFLAGGVSYLRQRASVALLFGLPVVVTVTAALLLNRPLRPRFMFFAVAFALLFTVRGASTVGGFAGRLIGTGTASSWGASVMVALLTAGAVGLSVRSLPYGYRYAKQDYTQAVAFVEGVRRVDDVVVVVGDGGEIPIVRYLGRPWNRIDTGADLRASRANSGGPTWVISTFSSYAKGGQPDLWAMLTDECSKVHEVPATVDDGAIAIHRCP